MQKVVHFSPSEADYLCRLVVVADWLISGLIHPCECCHCHCHCNRHVIIVNALTIFDEYSLSAN